MNENAEIFCLNKRHSHIVCEFLQDLQDIINEVTFYDEDYEGFKEVIEKIILFHNGLGVYAVTGEIHKINWYLSMPNTVYWATIGYFASMTPEKKEDLDEYREKVLSLISVVIKRLETSLVIQPGTENEEKINLN
jgi:hypothetical protein